MFALCTDWTQLFWSLLSNNRVPVLNEMGLDPGMDHMSAMQVIHEVQANGGTWNLSLLYMLVVLVV